MPEVLPNTRRLLERYSDLPFTLNNLAHVPATEGPDSPPARDLLRWPTFRARMSTFGEFREQDDGECAARELLLASSRGSARGG